MVAPPLLHLRRARLGVAAAFLAHGVLFGAWASRIPLIQTQCGLDPTSLGFALLGGAGGAVLAMSIAGLAAGRRGSHVVTVAMLAGYAFMLPWLAVTDSFASLLMSLLVFGAFQGSMDVAMNANALAVEQAGSRPIMSRLHGAWSIGSFLGASSTIASLNLGISIHAQYLALAAAGMALAVGLWFSLMAHRHSVEGPALRRPPRSLLAIGFLIYAGMLAEGSASDWSGIFMRKSVLSGEQEAALALGAFSVAMACSRLVGDRLTEKLGGGRLLATGAVLSAFGLGGALALNMAWPSIAGFAMLGLGLGSIVPIVLRASGSQPGIPAGIGIAAASTMGYAGALTGPPIIGLVAGAVGIRAALGVVVLLLVTLAVFAPRVVTRPLTASEPAVPTELG